MNMWKTVALRMTQAKTELEQMGEDTDGMLESTAKYRDLIKASTGFDILEEDQKTLKSTYEIVLNIGKAWDSLNDLDRNALLYALAGTRQSNALAAALTNIEDMEKAYQAAENSAGSAQEEQKKYTKSIQYSIDVFKAAKEEFANNLYDSKGLKNTIDGFTKMLEIINSLTKAVGGLGTAFVGLMAYKGFKGQNIFNVLGTGVSGVNNIKNFFTQPVLTDTAVKLGITKSDIKILQDYNHSLQNGTNATLAFRQTMKGASPETRTFAKEMARGNASINQLTTSSKAAAMGMTALNTAMNIAVSWLVASVISSVVKWFQELSKAEEGAAEQAHKIAEQSKGLADKRQKEYSSLTDLIAKYKELAETEGNASVTSREKLRDIQKEITELVGKQANNIDLVNGKLDEELAKLNSISDKVLNQSLEASKNAYRISQKDYANYQKKGNKKTTGKALFLADEYFIEPKSNTIRQVGNPNKLSINEQLDVINNLLDKYDKLRDESPNIEYLYNRLLEIQQELSPYAEEQSKAINDYLESFTIQQTNKRLSWVTSLEMYFKARQEIVDELVNDPTINKAIEDGYLTNLDLSKYVDEYLSTISSLDKFRASQSSLKADATFDYEDYKEEINGITKSVQTLSSAYEKLKKGEVTDSDLLSLFDEFPELSAYANDTDKLAKEVQKLARSEVEPLVSSLLTLRETVKDPEQLEQLDGLVLTLTKLGNLSTGIDKTAEALEKVTASDYIKYEEDRVQDIIDKLEKEKDAQNDILDSLKAQKEELESIISDYEKTADVVGKFIDRTEIEPLNDRKSEIEEYYNTEIEKLKEENEERDRNIDLQKKQDALANARKNKVRVYSETGGWHFESDITAIKQAKDELADLQNNITIDDLEKQRDAEVKDIESQIKAWKEYKDQWKEQVDAITEADEELTASKILGSDWREKIANKDISVMNDFSAGYVAYNNRLNNQVNVEIASVERAISERDREIENWKDYKTQIGDLNKDITESNQKYLEGLNQFVLDENSTWETRIEHLKRNKEILSELNNQANAEAEQTYTDALNDSGVWAITRDGNPLKIFSNKADAIKAKEDLVKKLVNEQVVPGMPSSVIETITQRIIEALEIKKYARGGVNVNTGLAWLDGTRANSEVVFNSSQASELYDMVKNGNFGKMVAENILTNMQNAFATLINRNKSADKISQLSISFPNAQINARDYDTFKGFMDRYTNDLLLKMQVGL